MTVTNELNKMYYTGTGSVDTYAYDFKIFFDEDLEVIVVDTFGNEATLALNTDYTVTGAGNAAGGNVVLTNDLTSNYSMVIRRNIGLTQETHFRNQGVFFPERHEDAFDRGVMLTQQTKELISRTLTLPDTIDPDVSVVLPSPDAGHVLGWSADGLSLENLAAASASLQTDLAVYSDVSKGDALLGVKLLSTGSIARTQHARNEEWPTPEDFGAVGDGTTNDTAAIQALINAYKSVRFTPGKIYNVSLLIPLANITIMGHGSKLIHRAEAGLTGHGIIEALTDITIKIYDLEIDGNYANQSATQYSYNFILCSIGSLQLFNCYIHDSKGHLIRTGNVDDFNASYFAHDIIIDKCIIKNPTSASGDCIRIERTQGNYGSNRIINNVVYGGLSGIRTHLYCKNLKIAYNNVSYCWGDVGITVAMSEHLEVLYNDCHHNFNHGFESDAVVDCLVMGNRSHENGGSGFVSAELGAAAYANAAQYAGSISADHGTLYSAQVYASPYVPSIDCHHIHNISFNNTAPDRIIGQNTDLYAFNILYGNNAGDANGQIAIEGGSLNRTSSKIFNNIFMPNTGDTQLVNFYNYSYDASFLGNKIRGNIKFGNVSANGMRDANENNKYLLDVPSRNVAFVDANDATSKSGHCISVAVSDTTAYYLGKVFCGGGGEKRIRIIARVNSGTQAATIAVNLFTAADAYVATTLEDSAITLTNVYQEFSFRIPSSSSAGNYIKPQITITGGGKTLYVQEVNVYVNE
jgi:hypothetical protein